MRSIIAVFVACAAALATALPIEPGKPGNDACVQSCNDAKWLQTSGVNADRISACNTGCLMMSVVQREQAQLPYVMQVRNCTQACGVAYSRYRTEQPAPMQLSCRMGCQHDQYKPKPNVLPVQVPVNPPQQQWVDDPLQHFVQLINAPDQNAQPMFGADGHDMLNPFAHEFVPPPANGQVVQEPPRRLIGGRHDVAPVPRAPRPLIGGSHDVVPAPQPLQPQQPHPQHLLGEDGGVRNPFAFQFHPPPPPPADDFFNPIILNGNDNEHGVFDTNFDAFFEHMQRMHERMNDMIRQEMNKVQNAHPNVDDLVGEIHPNGVNPQVFIEVERFPVNGPPQRFAWSNNPAMQAQLEGNLDLTDHEPSPPTNRRLEDNRLSQIEVDYMPHDARSASWLQCLAYKAAHLGHVARVLVFLSLLLCIISMLVVCMHMCRSVRRRRRLLLLQQHPASTAQVQIATVDKGIMAPPAYSPADVVKAAEAAKVHSPPPPYQGIQNPNYTENEQDKDKNTEATA